jgi:hypothetical protein
MVRVPLSNGKQTGPRIGIEKGPLTGVGGRLVPVANWRVPRASRSALTSDGAARAWEVPVCPPGQAGVALRHGFLGASHRRVQCEPDFLES